MPPKEQLGFRTLPLAELRCSVGTEHFSVLYIQRQVQRTTQFITGCQSVIQSGPRDLADGKKSWGRQSTQGTLQAEHVQCCSNKHITSTGQKGLFPSSQHSHPHLETCDQPGNTSTGENPERSGENLWDGRQTGDLLVLHFLKGNDWKERYSERTTGNRNRWQYGKFQQDRRKKSYEETGGALGWAA